MKLKRVKLTDFKIFVENSIADQSQRLLTSSKNLIRQQESASKFSIQKRDSVLNVRVKLIVLK